MRTRFADAIDAHRLRPEIIATKVANRVVNRLGLAAPFELAEEAGASMAHVASAYFAVDAIFGLESLFEAIEQAAMPETTRLMLLDAAGGSARLHVADAMRAVPGDLAPGTLAGRLAPYVGRLRESLDSLLKQEARSAAGQLRARISAEGAPDTIVDRIVHLFELDGAIGTAMLAADLGGDELAITQAYVRLGEALGLDWAHSVALRFQPGDTWERLLAAGLVRDFEQLRLDFLARGGSGDPMALVQTWLATHQERVAQFRALIDRARQVPSPTAAMLAQIAARARGLLAL
jgi:glutamate dehydrogenase